MTNLRWEQSVVEGLISSEPFDQLKSQELDSIGLTALGWTVLFQRWDLADKLLAKGVDPNVSCADDLSALQMVFVAYSPNMYALPTFRPSYYYFYTEGISPQSRTDDQENIPPHFVTSLFEHGMKLVPDKWMVTALSVVRMWKLEKETKLMESNLELSVRDVLESSTLEAVSLNMENIPNRNLTDSVKHGVPLSGSSLLHLWNKSDCIIEKHLIVLEKIKLLYPFPSIPVKIYLNITFTALNHKFQNSASPEKELTLFKLFNIYLELVCTDYPEHFLHFFSDDALKCANKELRIIYHFQIHLKSWLETQYLDNTTVEWAYPIFALFEKNYAQLMKLDMLPYQGEPAKGEGLIYRLMLILADINACTHDDSRFNEYYEKWMDNLNDSLCRKLAVMSIVILYSHTQYNFKFTSEFINFLLRHGININERSRDSLSSCLHTTVQIDDPELFLFLLDKNAYLFTVDKSGLTALNMIHMKYPDTKMQYLENPKVNPPFPLKSLAAQVLSEHAKLNQIFVGHHDSYIYQFLSLHSSS